MEPSWQRSPGHLGCKAQKAKDPGLGPGLAPGGWGPPGTLLVVQYNVWLPDLLRRDAHELSPIIVGRVPLQLVVVPDLGEEAEKDQRGLLLLTPPILVTSTSATVTEPCL